MEGEKEEQGESTQSETTSTEADTLPQDLSETMDLDHDQPDRDTCDEQEAAEPVEENLCSSPQETLIVTDTPCDAVCLLLGPLRAESPPPESSHVSGTQNHQPEPCWYCLRSLDPEYRPETPGQEDSDLLSPLPSSGQKVSYQTDPRPHFGVAWSSHSTCRPLWGSEGPCWGQRHQEVPDQTHTCPHCHLGLPPDTLRWHEAKCLLFEGLRNSKK